MRGHVVDITDKLTPESAPILAQWIGGANVIRNQKIRDNEATYQEWLKVGGDKPAVDQAASHIHKLEGLEFLKDIPSPIRRNAASCWFQDMTATFKGIRKAPRSKGKGKKRSCYVTKELYTVDRLDDNHCVVRIRRSNKKADLHSYILNVRMPFHKADAANSLRISRQGARFWLSMAYRIEFDVPDEQAIRDSFAGLTEQTAAPLVGGYDIGVKRQVTDHEGRVFHLHNSEAEQLKRLEKRRIRYQRKYARMARANDRKAGTTKRKRSNNEQAMSAKLAQMEAKRARIRKSESHRISKEIAEAAPIIAGFEDIKLNNLTRKPKAKVCPDTGKWLRNGARAKAGLNKAILSLNLGQIRIYTAYKLEQRGKLMVKVRAAYSSQECAECGHTEKANRPSQEVFQCQSCGHEDNADNNAARVIRKRAIQLALSDTFAKGAKKAKRITARKQQALDTASRGSSQGSGADVRRDFPQPALMQQTEDSCAV